MVGAALAAAGLAQFGGNADASNVTAASPSLRVTIRIVTGNDGLGDRGPEYFAVYASDTLDNGGLSYFSIGLSGVFTVNNLAPAGLYSDPNGGDDIVGFYAAGANDSFLQGGQITDPTFPPPGETQIEAYGLGQTAGNLAILAVAGSTGADGPTTQAVYGAPLLLANGTFDFTTETTPCWAAIATGEQDDSARVFVTNSGYATEPATLYYIGGATITPLATHSGLLSVMASGAPSPAYIGTGNPGGAGNSSTITLSKNGTGYVPGLLNNITANATAGTVTINGYDGNGPELISVAIKVSDGGNATPHAPSAQEIADIIADLNSSPLLVSGVTATVEAFNGSTAGTLQHDSFAAYSLLSSANSADGGQTLELAVLISGLNSANPQTFGLDFGNESADGIMAVDVTDLVVTEVPEPASLSLLAVGSIGLLARRRRK